MRAPSAVAGLALVGAISLYGSMSMAANPEQNCQDKLSKAAVAYNQCVGQALYKSGANTTSSCPFGIMSDVCQKYIATVVKCRLKYTGLWQYWQGLTSLSGTSCQGPRFTTATSPLGDTVTDHLTGLEWEKKAVTGQHDKNQGYSYSAPGPDFTSNGSAFWVFLGSNMANVVSQYDWHLPSVAQLQTILLEGGPCTMHPCIDSVFGPINVGAKYWTTNSGAGHPAPFVWLVNLDDGQMGTDIKTSIYYARAVRGGNIQ